MTRLKKIVLALSILGMFLYLGACGYMYRLQDEILFYPTVPNQEQIEANKTYEVRYSHDDAELVGWLINPGKVSSVNPLIVYYGGNGEDISNHLPKLERISGSTSFLFMNYRGYGRSQGKPGQAALLADASFILDEAMRVHAISIDEVVLIGRSLGSSVAVHMAHERDVRGLILITPFDSIAEVAAEKYPYLPVHWLIRHPFDSAALAVDVEQPVLFLLASDDGVVSPTRSRNLIDVWKGEVHELTIPGTGHNSILKSDDTWRAVNDFLALLARAG